MSCACDAGLTVQLHGGGDRYPVIPAARHGELSFWFDARCTRCNDRYEAPFARVDGCGEALADQTGDLPLVDVMWLRRQCGPFTCGCDQDQLDPAAAAPEG
ncbi:hypothetical protein ACFU7Y_41890 [Kitasatospora sp. NPDC057542]|uniref:hypothetical protein n=1 Tax=Kitasatospora sp. NPDC057542 TaxID=3346162 RepID=UPI0036BA911E